MSTYKKGGLVYMMSEVDRMRQELDLERNVSRLAAQYLKQTVEADEVIIKSYDKMATAILHVTCQQKGIPLLIDDIIATTRPNVSRKGVLKKAKQVKKALPVEINLRNKVKFTAEYGEDLNLTKEDINNIRDLAERMKSDNVLVNKQTKSFAGAVIYAYSKLNDLGLSQKEVSNEIGVTTVTIRENYKKVYNSVEGETPARINPPDTIAEAFDLLNELSESQARKGRELYDSTNKVRDPTESAAGIAGGAFIIAGERNDGITNADEVAEVVGAGTETVRQYAEEINERG